MKPWIFYVILAWQIAPLAPEEQKTLILQFDSRKECMSIAEQVEMQVKQAQSIFYLKENTCVSCESLYGKERCAPPVKDKAKDKSTAKDKGAGKDKSAGKGAGKDKGKHP